ncbi:uncharacterized protein LOC142748488 [Rhinoderma darwinii]|uniref:uncharacterized protein LOC142748488 n=1 Tax=Rhinoderma darwinii TaxID=43563 RepID=UPI003F668CEA
MDVEKMICLVQERHEIWDTRADSYHDRSAKEVAWDYIAQALFYSEWEKSTTRDRQRIVQDIKTRWRSCRDKFRREFGGRSGDGASKKRRYISTKQLMFLKDIMEMRSTTDNLNDSDEESDHTESQPHPPSSRLLPLTPEPTPQDPAPVESAPPAENSPARRRRTPHPPTILASVSLQLSIGEDSRRLRQPLITQAHPNQPPPAHAYTHIEQGLTGFPLVLCLPVSAILRNTAEVLKPSLRLSLDPATRHLISTTMLETNILSSSMASIAVLKCLLERMPYTLADHALLDWLIYRRFRQQAMLDEEPLRKRRRYWVHPIVSQRPRKGHFHTLYDDLRQHPEKFHNFCRMSISSFDCLLSDLGPGITLQDTNMRQCISPEERLIVTLRFLATGNSFASLHFEFLLGCSTISQIIRLTCEVIWQRLRAAVMPQPKAEDWLRIAEGFYQSAQFPNCVGALDGKHIRVQKPPHSGCLYFNYKQYFSVVLLALADSDYRFVIVDIGAYGSSSDAGIFRASKMGERLQSNQLALPEPRQLPGSTGPPAPFVIVADEGFGLSLHVLRPFPQRGLDERRHVFNYRLTRSRRYVECAFGILSSKWRVFQSPLQMDPQNVMLVIQTSVILHNFCRLHESMQDIDLEQFPTTSTIQWTTPRMEDPGQLEC